MTAKYLLQLLFKTFVFSLALSLIFGSIYYIVTVSLADYRHVLPSIVTGSLSLTVILTLMFFAILFFTTPSIYAVKSIRFLMYFGGTLVFLAFLLIKHMSPSNTIFYGISGLSFLIVQSIFYFLMVKKYPA